MKQHFNWLTLIVLFVAKLLFAGVYHSPQVVNQWSIPAAKRKIWELAPRERTRPVVVGDLIFSAGLDGRVLALHRLHGYVVWEKQLPGGVEGSLSYGRSKLVVGDLQGNLFALNVRDGSEAWVFKSPSPWLSPAAIYRDKIFAFNAAEDLYALSETRGTEVWHYSRRGDEKMTVRGTAGPTVFGNEVFQGFADGHVAALSAGDGRLLWTKRLRTRERFYDVDMNLYADEKSVIAATFDGKIYSLDRVNGEIKWSFPVGSYGGFSVEEDRLYFTGLDRNVYSLDRNSGFVQWKTQIEGGVGMGPAKLGNVLIVTTSWDPMFILDAQKGTVLWKGSLGAGSLAGVTTSSTDSSFYCLSNYGNLFSFELKENVLVNRGPETLAGPSAIERTLAANRTATFMP